MASVNQLETVLRYAYLHGFTSEQWLEPTKECLENNNLESEFCSLLINAIFSFTRVSDPILESYLTIAATGKSILDNNININNSNVLINSTTVIKEIAPLGESTATKHPHQWSYFLKLLLVLLSSFNTDTIVSDLQKGEENEWVDILSQVLQLLSHLVAVGLYSDWYNRSTSPTIMTPATLTSAISFHNNNTQLDSQFSFQSQLSMQFDPDATLDIDNTQQIDDDENMDISNDNDDNISSPIKESLSQKKADTQDSQHHQQQLQKKTKTSIEIENAALAAHIMIHLIEKRDAKRIFEVKHIQRRQAGYLVDEQEPWAQCQAKLEPKNNAIKSNISSVASQNPHIQKLLVLIQRLTDRDLERRLAVHMKYHELEDEGTARAMPSAGLMGLMYHMVQIRPTLDDNEIIDHLLKLQTIKGSFDESFYLELWLTALTGLREASLNTSCQSLPLANEQDKEDKSCSALVAMNRLLWKSLVLVKLPCLIHKLKLKQQETFVKEEEYNSIEASLRELKAFTGLINACSPPACCPEFFAPDSMSSMLVERIAFGEGDDDDDDIMNMINNVNYTTELNSTAINKSIRSINNNDIFTNLVHVCERLGTVRPEIALELLKSKQSDMMDVDDNLDKMSPMLAIEQNIDSKFETLKVTVSFDLLTELLHIGLVSPIHLRKIIDFVLELLRTKSITNEFYSLSKICDALSECPCFVDLILQLYTPSDLLGPLGNICNHWNPAENEMYTEDESTTRRVEDEEELEGVQLLYSKYGKILNFVISVVNRFKLYRDLNKVFSDTNECLYKYFTQGTIIFGIDIEEPSMESFINSWMNALAGDGLSDNLLLTTKPQNLLLIVPTIIQRGVLLCSSSQMEQDVLLGMISFFQKRYLDFTIASILIVLSQELLDGESEIALVCLRQLIMSGTNLPRETNLHSVLGSLESMIQFKQQEVSFISTKEDEEKVISLIADMNELKDYIVKDTRMTKLTEDHSIIHVETVSTDVTPSTLFEKATLMFKYIVKSGRSMFMSDVDADTYSLWDDHGQSNKSQVVSHYLDMVLFETALEIGGPHWFVDMIVEQVLEAGKSGGAVRAAELGSSLISIPLLYSTNKHNNCVHLLRCLLQDILPNRLSVCVEQNMSYFQGQTLGVFVSDCLVLTQDKYESVHQLGRWFFEALVVDSESQKKEVMDQVQIIEGTRFANWNSNVIKSAVWRGFIKGLMSNPLIEEVWPNAFI